MGPAMPRLRHAPSSPLLEKPNVGCNTRCLCCRSARDLICLLSTNEDGGRGELELDCRCFFLGGDRDGDRLRDRSSFGGDRAGDRRLLDTVTTAVFLERSCDGLDCRCFFFFGGDRDGDRLRDRSSFGGDRAGDRRLLDTVTTAVFLERSCDGANFLLRESALLVAANALVLERSRDGRNGGFNDLFLAAATAVASMALMASMAAMAAVSSRFTLATNFFLLFARLELLL